MADHKLLSSERSDLICLRSMVYIYIHICVYTHAPMHPHTQLKGKPYKDSIWAKDPAINSIVTFHFILAGKPGNSSRRNIVNSERLPQLKKDFQVPTDFLLS